MLKIPLIQGINKFVYRLRAPRLLEILNHTVCVEGVSHGTIKSHIYAHWLGAPAQLRLKGVLCIDATLVFVLKEPFLSVD